RADYRAVLVEAVVIAGDRAGADIGFGTYLRIAEIGEVIGLGAGTEPGGFDLDKIADVDVALQHRAGAQPCVRADNRAFGDGRAIEMREGANVDIIRDANAGTEHDIR